MGCCVVAEFLLTSVSRSPSAIAEPLVLTTYGALPNSYNNNNIVAQKLMQLLIRDDVTPDRLSLLLKLSDNCQQVITSTEKSFAIALRIATLHYITLH